MKLIICTQCWDGFFLAIKEERQCHCGNCKGQYVDKVNAEYSGNTALPVAILNKDLTDNFSKQGPEGLAVQIPAYIMPKILETFKKMESGG